MKLFVLTAIISIQLITACEGEESPDATIESTQKQSTEIKQDTLLDLSTEQMNEESERMVFFEDYVNYNSHKELIHEFGAEQVSSDSILVFEGTESRLQSILYLKDEKIRLFYIWNPYGHGYDELQVHWTHYDDRNEKVVFNPVMKSKTGVATGMTLKGLCDLNGAPISFMGFGWDYGGIVSSYNGGKLTDIDITVHLAPLSYLDEQHAPIDEQYVGDLPFSTETHPDVLNEGIVVVSMVLHGDEALEGSTNTKQ